MSADMSSAEYWRERCQLAERALQAARAGIEITPARRDVLRVLGELRPGEAISTEAVAQRVERTIGASYEVLKGLRAFGLVDSLAVGRQGAGVWALWRLGHLVIVQDEREAETC